jgi:hypothetical protein
MTDSPWLGTVREALEPLRRTKHYVCDEDCWYTCPAATEEHDGGNTCKESTIGGPCDCGLDAHNAKVDETAAVIARKIEAALDAAAHAVAIGAVSTFPSAALRAFRGTP